MGFVGLDGRPRHRGRMTWTCRTEVSVQLDGTAGRGGRHRASSVTAPVDGLDDGRGPRGRWRPSAWTEGVVERDEWGRQPQELPPCDRARSTSLPARPIVVPMTTIGKSARELLGLEAAPRQAPVPGAHSARAPDGAFQPVVPPTVGNHDRSGLSTVRSWGSSFCPGDSDDCVRQCARSDGRRRDGLARADG